jgi:hypothetical protein
MLRTLRATVKIIVARTTQRPGFVLPRSNIRTVLRLLLLHAEMRFIWKKYGIVDCVVCWCLRKSCRPLSWRLNESYIMSSTLKKEVPSSSETLILCLSSYMASHSGRYYYYHYYYYYSNRAELDGRGMWHVWEKEVHTGFGRQTWGKETTWRTQA